VSGKSLPKPCWYKNTYFWFAAILFILAIIGLPFVFGDDAIRDPGQKHEGWLSLIYFVGSIVMLLNGIMSHRQTIQQYEEQGEQK